jgi:hypothetical protein
MEISTDNRKERKKGINFGMRSTLYARVVQKSRIVVQAPDVEQGAEKKMHLHRKVHSKEQKMCPK